MISDQRVLAVIPARGGSKGVPGKNIRQVAGLPLIGWTIEEAKKSRYIDKLILSSEDPLIIQAAVDLGCEVPFVRPVELSQDNTPGIDPVIHALSVMSCYDYVVLLQPTSPLRLVEDINAALELCVDKNASACVSVTEVHQHPSWMYRLDQDHRMNPVLETTMSADTRQELPELHIINGAIYVAKCEWIVRSRTFVGPETVAYRMPMDRSIDIDTEMDLALAEVMLDRRKAAM